MRIKKFVGDPISHARMRELFREKRAVKDSIGRPAIALVFGIFERERCCLHPE